MRKVSVAGWLAPADPRLAALRAGDAVLAALEVRALARGERYFKAKWLGEKLARLGDTEGLALLDAALAPPLEDPVAARAYVSRAAELVGELLGPADRGGWRVVLTPAAGVEARAFGDRTLVSRWQLRTTAVATGDLPAALGGVSDGVSGEQAPQPLWEAPLGEPLPPAVAALVRGDLCWLGLRDAG